MSLIGWGIVQSIARGKDSNATANEEYLAQSLIDLAKATGFFPEELEGI
jgi:hypothetical protein